jgi:hypothetical protein
MNDVYVPSGRGAQRFAKLPLHRSTWSAILLTAASLVVPRDTQAVSYATCLTNSSGVISFRLNESADMVKILSNGGATVNDLGALPAGLHTITLDVNGAFQVSVFKTSPVGFAAPIAPNVGATLQISTDDVTTRFREPRGLAINNDPASPNFGRVYVSHGSNGVVAASAFGPARTLTEGIFVLNADLSDAVGQGDVGRTAGISFATGGDDTRGVSPYRISVGQDGNLYVADWSDTGGTLWVTDPDVNPGTGQNVLGGPIGGPFPVTATRIHGSIAAAVVEGSLAGGNLTAYVIDEDLQNDRASTTQNMRNTLWRHDIGGALPGAEVLPTRIGSTTPWINFASQTMDLSRGANGNFYVNDYRSVGNDRGGLYVIAPDGTELWNSLAASRTLLGSTAVDLLRTTGSGAVAPRGDFVAGFSVETNGIIILPLVDGIPDITNRLTINPFGNISQGRDLAFDLAGNLYAVHSGAQSLRVFSPGGTTTAITGSDGTFELIRPSAVSVAATDNLATEGSDTATFTITRTGDTASELTVSYTLTGTAINGTDYTTNELSAVIPAGASSVDVTITTIDDTETESVEQVTLTVLPASTYDIKAPVLADVAIADNEPSIVSIATIDGNAYERFPTDTITFRISRTGETNSELFVVYEPNSGVAINGVDFGGIDFQQLPGIIILAAGQSSQTLAIAPIDDSDVEGDESLTVTLSSDDPSYAIGTATATGIIGDNDQPSVGIVYADSLDTDTSANWTTLFGANNGIYDAEVKWAFDYSTIGVPAAPNSQGSTTGLFVQVNKTNATAGGSSAINLYPTGQSFSGNFVLRFDMLLNFGTASATEHALVGIHHSGQRTNRVTQSADPNGTVRGGDGIYVAIESDGSNNRDWTAYTYPTPTNAPTAITNRTAASLASVITAPPYAFPGSPGSGPSSADKTWAEVELSQSNSIVTLKVNNNVIYSFANTSPFSSGNIMLGMNDQFDSVGSGGTTGNFVIFDNVRVLTLDTLITSTVRLGNGDMQIDFVSPSGGAPADYRVESASSLTLNDWANETDAVITATVQGFRCVVPANGPGRFYRIKR